MGQLPSTDKDKIDKGINILSVFSYVGGALVFFGIAAFIDLNWDVLSKSIKIFSTLGAGIAAYISGILFNTHKDYQRLGSAFILISGLVLPIGIAVTFTTLPWLHQPCEIRLTLICLSVFLISQLYAPKTIFLLFTILFASLFFIALTHDLVSASTYRPLNLVNYELISLGLSYISLAYYIDQEKTHPLAGPLYFFGALFVLGSSFDLGSFWFLDGNMPWKIMNAILILAGFCLAIPLKSKSFLYWSAIFLELFVMDETYYFAKIFGYLGWPLILILSGFLVMALGYVIFNLHKKITSKQ